MSERLILWGPPVVESSPLDPDYVEHLPGWVEKCADVGVTKIIDGSARVLPWGDLTRALTEAAHQVGIKFDPYVDYNSFPRYGSSRVTRAWSLDFLRRDVTAPGSRETMDQHRPIYDPPKVSTTIADFATQHPQYRRLTRSRPYNLQPGEDLYLSPAFPEVRAHQVRMFVDVLKATNGDGIQVECVLGNEDEDGVVTYGYEDRTVSEFRAKYGKDPFELPNNDPEWMQFRADYMTLFLSELRDGIKQTSPDAVLSTTIIAAEEADYIKVLQDWPAWIEQGLLDEFYIWFRTDSDLKALERQVRLAVDVAAGRVPVIAELSCYHPGSFQDPDLMVSAGRIAVDNGASGVGIYKSHAVEQLDFWPVLEDLGKI